MGWQHARERERCADGRGPPRADAPREAGQRRAARMGEPHGLGVAVADLLLVEGDAAQQLVRRQRDAMQDGQVAAASHRDVLREGGHGARLEHDESAEEESGNEPGDCRGRARTLTLFFL